MGWGSYELHFDLDRLNSQAKAVRKIEEDLSSASDRLTSQLDLLKGEWKSDAGDAFFEKYETSWITHIQRYCEMLRAVADELDKTVREYEPLVTEYDAIHL